MTANIKLDANEHPIKSVTVFKSKKAEVVRIFKVSLEEGQSKVQIRNLSGSIDTESVRVTGLGDAQLFDVVCSFGTEEIDTSSNAEAVRKLNARRDLLDENIERYFEVSGMMMTHARSLTGSSMGPQQAETFFESLLSRSCAMASARADLDEEILQLERQTEALSSTRTKKQGRTDGEVSVVIMAKKAADIELRLTYLVRNATWFAAYELHATTEAGVPARSVSLHYRARITQSTGEDWTDVGLTLSTADMDRPNKTIPVLSPTKIRPPVPGPLFDFKAGGYAKPPKPPQPITVGQTSVPPALPTQLIQSSNTGLGVGGNAPTQKPPQPIVVGQTSIPPAQPMKLPNTGIGASSTPAGITSAKKAQPIPPPPPSGLMRDLYRAITQTQSSAVPTDEWQEIKLDAPVSAQVITTANGKPMSVVHESPLASTYRVEGASGVPSDGVSHQVCIAVLPFEAKIQHVTVPKERQEAYLEATVKNTSDYRLLPGTVHAFVDDSFVSKISIDGDVAPGGEFNCTLGADPATRIRYVRMSKRADDAGPAGERRAFTEQWAATTYRSRMTVTNQHPFALRELVVRDGLPVSENEKCVSVVLRRPAGLADLEQGEECEVGAKDGGREGEGKRHSVRWSKAVDGKGGKKEGLFEWVVEVGAGEELTIDTEWDVKAPTSLRWVEST